MPRQNDPTSDSHTLPPAELNPLLNPLLGENMGRWAEVYFTSPPESREEAVFELLRELEAEKSRRDGEISAQGSVPILVRCNSCGHHNPTTHKFCGMCGMPVAEEGTDPDFRRQEILNEFRSSRDDQPEIRSHESLSEDVNPETRPYMPPSSNHNELSLFQNYGAPEPEDGSAEWTYEPPPSHSYRGYIAAVLAVLILALGYMAWRGTQNAQDSPASSSAPPAAAKEAEPTAPPPSSPPVTNEAENAPVAKSPSGAPPSQPAETARKKPVSEASRPEPTRRSAADSVKTTDAMPSGLTAEKGTEELAVAQRYLNGANGQRRDTAEASKWLWKSIAKHNGDATLLLADLYLKGDGVSKNCDQARVLLDSAARKGIAGAGERLRNLQAFGCQ